MENQEQAAGWTPDPEAPVTPPEDGIGQLPEGLAESPYADLETKIVYQCDSTWKYIGALTAFESPEDKAQGRPRVWMIPAYCVEIPPLPELEGSDIYWMPDTETWEYREIPPPMQPPGEAPLTPEQIYDNNLSMKRSLLQLAALEIAPLQDAVDFGEATPLEEALLTEWKQYRIAVNRVDLTLAQPNWPNQPR